MFLYTIVPIQEVMNLNTDEITKQNIVYLNAGSGLLAVEMMEHGKGKIINLISSDPYDYMNSSWTPGSIIDIFSKQHVLDQNRLF